MLDTIIQLLAPPAGDRPQAGWLEARLRVLIKRGDLPSGTHLPPIRSLAWALKCAPGTVAKAYAGLKAEGLTKATTGRGTVVTDWQKPPSPSDTLTDFSENTFGFLPLDDTIRSVFGEAALAAASAPQHPPDPAGDIDHRERLIGHLSAPTHYSAYGNLVLTSGTHNALISAIAGLVAPGGVIACDELTYPGLVRGAQFVGRRLVGIGMDAAGMDPERLASMCRSSPPAALVLMPDIHNPTTTTMPLERREAIAALCHEHEILIFEDGIYDGLLESRPPSFLDLAPERALRMNSLSKVVAPSLRIGFVLGPEKLAARVAAAHAGFQLFASPILSGIATALLERNLVKKRTSAIRAGLRRRALDVASLLPGVGEGDVAAGMVWWKLGDAWTADGFAKDALEEGLKLLPARTFSPSERRTAEAVRLCIGSFPDDATLREGLLRLAAIHRRGPRIDILS